MFEKSSIHDRFKKMSSFFRKAQIIKKIKHFHQEEHSKAFQAFKERRKKKDRAKRTETHSPFSRQKSEETCFLNKKCGFERDSPKYGRDFH